MRIRLQLQRDELKRSLSKLAVRKIPRFLRLDGVGWFPAPEVKGMDGEVMASAEVSQKEVAEGMVLNPLGPLF